MLKKKKTKNTKAVVQHVKVKHYRNVVPLKSDLYCLVTVVCEIAHIIWQLQSLLKTLSNPTTLLGKPIPYARGHGRRFVPEHKIALPPSNRRAEEEATLDPTCKGGWALETSSRIVTVAVVDAGGVLRGVSSSLSEG